MKLLIVHVLILSVFGILNGNPVPETEAETETGEYGNEYQGDILLTPEQKEELEHEGRSGRTGSTNSYHRWPKINGKVTVPYVIDNVYTTSEKNLIFRAMTEIETKTCVDFVARTSQTDYINIYSGGGCNSYLGRIGGMQYVSLKRSGCMVHGIVMHELIHALGYQHMHQHSDRDQKVYISWGNIQSGMDVWFNKFAVNQYNNYGTPYDVASVMHYGPYAFSKNGYRTITAYSSADQNVMGQRSYLSSGDIARIKNMYSCP